MLIIDKETTRVLRHLEDLARDNMILSAIWNKLENRLRYLDTYGEKTSEENAFFGKNTGTKTVCRLGYDLQDYKSTPFEEVYEKGQYNFSFSIFNVDKEGKETFWMNGGLIMHSSIDLTMHNLTRLAYAGKEKDYHKDPEPFTLKQAEIIVKGTSWSVHT